MPYGYDEELQFAEHRSAGKISITLEKLNGFWFLPSVWVRSFDLSRSKVKVSWSKGTRHCHIIEVVIGTQWPCLWPHTRYHPTHIKLSHSTSKCIQISFLRKRKRIDNFSSHSLVNVYDLNSNFVYFELFFNKTKAIPSGCLLPDAFSVKNDIALFTRRI